LYDLEEDPGEHRDLRFFFPEKIDELKTIYRKWKEDMEASASEIGS